MDSSSEASVALLLLHSGGKQKKIVPCGSINIWAFVYYSRVQIAKYWFCARFILQLYVNVLSKFYQTRIMSVRSVDVLDLTFLLGGIFIITQMHTYKLKPKQHSEEKWVYVFSSRHKESTCSFMNSFAKTAMRKVWTLHKNRYIDIHVLFLVHIKSWTVYGTPF